MKLSEAIRLGSMLKPQAFGEYVHYRGRGGSCALGAASEAAGIRLNRLSTVWPNRLHGIPCPSPGCIAHCHGTFTTIGHLNDDHRWTREQIADWVATIEPADVVAEPLVESMATEAGQ